MIERISVPTTGKGLHEMTADVQAVVSASGLAEGLCTVMIQHTSASLTIQENADPSARADLENWLERHVPENARHLAGDLPVGTPPARVESPVRGAHRMRNQ